MTDAPSYADLERRYTGPIPQEALDRLRYGSSLNAEIARVEDLIAYYFREITSMERSARRWLERGDKEMHDANLADVEFNRRHWRANRERLTELREEARNQDRARAERAQLLNAKRVLDLIGEVANGRPDDG